MRELLSIGKKNNSRDTLTIVCFIDNDASAAAAA
jgi:hypothetical protein